MISLDTKRAADELHFPSLSVRFHWYKEVTEKPPEALEDWVPYAEMGVGPSRIVVPMSEWGPFVDRPLGLLVVPSPRNPLYYLTRFYKTTNPLCAAMLEQEERATAGVAADAADAAGAAAEGGDTTSSNSSSSRGFLSLMPFSFSKCTTYKNYMGGSSMPFVQRTQVTPDCLKEEFISNRELQMEIYTLSRYTPAPEYASWFPPSWRR